MNKDPVSGEKRDVPVQLWTNGILLKKKKKKKEKYNGD